MNLRVLILLVAAASLFGCCITPPGEKNDGITVSQDNGGTDTGDVSGGTVIVTTNQSGMSDPSKCRNLPPQQMADCLEQAIGN